MKKHLIVSGICILSLLTACGINEKATDNNHSEEVTSNYVQSNAPLTGNNQKKIDLMTVKPTEIKDFIISKIDQDGLQYYERDKNGDIAGWEHELYDGCGWWCTVKDSRTEVDVSSTLKATKRINYASSNILNSSKLNSWVEGADGDGIGEYIEISKQFLCYDNDIDGGRFGEICIVNGYAATEKLWKENNRVKTLLMYLDGKPYKYLELQDTIKPQYFNVWDNGEYKLQPSEEVKLKFEIVEIYKGEKYADTAISYLDVEFLKGH